MKIYRHNKNTGEYTGESEARLDPMETKKAGKKVYLTPANATRVKPPAAKKNKARVFAAGTWTAVDDYRGEEYYLPGDAQVHTITKLGDTLPGGALAEVDPVVKAAADVEQSRLTARATRNAALATVTVNINGVDVWASPADEQNIVGRIREMEANTKTECKWVQGADIFILTLDELKNVLAMGTDKCAGIFDDYIATLEAL